MHKIYLREDGRLTYNETSVALYVTQKQFENILCKSMCEDYCITKLLNYEQYKNNCLIRDIDIPEEVEYDFGEPEIEKEPTEYELNKKLNLFKRDNRNIIQNSFSAELAVGVYYCDNKLVNYTPSDRFNVQTMVAQGKGMWLNGDYYSPTELKNIYEKLENEILKINFYYNILLSLVDKLTIDDMNEKNYLYWGTYNEQIDKEMEKYEPPFE